MSNSLPLLLVIGGFAGAGKSTLARRLGRKLSMLVYEIDAIAKTIRGSDGAGTSNHNGLAFDIFFALAQHALNNNCGLIFDQNMGYAQTWRNLDALQNEVGKNKVKVFLLDCPYEVCLARFAARTEHPNLNEVTLNDLHQHKFKWDYLQENTFPQAVRIDATQSPDAVFAEVLSHLSPYLN